MIHDAILSDDHRLSYFSNDEMQMQQKENLVIFFCLAITSAFSSDSCNLFKESDEIAMSSHFRSLKMSQLIFNAITSSDEMTCDFKTDSIQKKIDCGASFSATSKKSDYTEDTHKPWNGVTISGIASGLQASGIGSTMLHLKDDDGIAVDSQIDFFTS